MRRLLILVLLLPAMASAQSRVLGNVVKALESEYIGVVDYDAAARDIMSRCDPYSTYISAASARELASYKAGKSYSVGITASVVGDSVAVVTMVDFNSPAYSAGIRAGDTVNRFKVAKDEVEFGWRGQMVRLKKKSYNVYAVSRAKMVGDVGYIKFDNFYYHAADSLFKVYKELKERGAKGMIIDLRDNGGGELSECIKVASMFLPRNTLLSYTKGKKKAYNTDVYTVRGLNDKVMPIVVIVGQRSASASEMFAAAMQDYKRGAVIGGKTYGKSVAQKLINVGSGAYINITVAQFFSPTTSRSFNHQNGGLSVDVEVAERYVKDDLLNDKAIEKACQILKI